MISSRPIRRRRLLATVGALPVLAAAACTTDPPKRGPDDVSETPADPLADVLELHVSLLASYDLTIATYPDLTQRLQPLREHTGEHISALAAAQAIAPPSPSATESASGSSATESAGPSSTPAPVASEAMIADLLAQENALVQVLTPLVASEPTERAPLLGSITAAHACHAAVFA